MFSTKKNKQNHEASQCTTAAIFWSFPIPKWFLGWFCINCIVLNKHYNLAELRASFSNISARLLSTLCIFAINI